MKKAYIIIATVSVLALLVGISFGYWLVYIDGNGAPIELTAQDLKIIFTDTEKIEPGKIDPGWTYSKTFTVKSETNETYKYKIIIKDLVNTFQTEYLKYKITSTDANGYKMTDYKTVPKQKTKTDTELTDSITIEPGETQEYTIEFIYQSTTADQSEDMGATLSGSLFVTEGVEKSKALTFFESKFKDAGKRTTFNAIVTASGKYKEDENYTEGGKTVYYYAGNATDNWVHFANKYWRIIRLNEDESIRLLYAGSSPTAEDAYINTMAYNPTYDNTTYVGYMYSTGSTLSAIRGNGTSSPIKTQLETWYTSNLQSYDKYISKTAIYCNDRSSQTGWANSGTMYYNGYTKFVTNKTSSSGNHPSFKCGVNGSGSLNSDSPDAERKKDMFSVSKASGGNGNLTKPIGLMTADEVIFAGGLYGTNNDSAYYYRNASGGSSTGTNWWWTMSPYYAGSSSYAGVFSVHGSVVAGNLNNALVNSTSGVVRPVIIH